MPDYNGSIRTAQNLVATSVGKQAPMPVRLNMVRLWRVHPAIGLQARADPGWNAA